MARRAEPALVLIADDVEDTRDMYRQFFELSGYRVVTAVDGADAVSVATERQPDIVIMDLMMPRVDGWEATRRLKADPRTRQIPIVALTGHGGRAGEVGRDVTFDGFLTKPLVPEQLLREIERFLRRA
jgi:two-component system, cell cycle response regulator DivK